MTRTPDPVKPLIAGLYEQACVGNGSGAVTLWRHPEDRRLEATSLNYWLNQARIAEQSGFDLFFFGDVLGVYDVYGGSGDAAIEGGTELPALDPLEIIPALAAHTTDLSFGATVSTTYTQPFSHARRFSTLDHITSGRIAWNIVTSYLPNAAANFGLGAQRPHDDRYARADEFLDVTYKLWEQSWDDGAVLADRESGRFADPALVRAIDHEGEHFRVKGPHLVTPSPQRTPVLIQAGWSPRGKQFAAKHAEVVFLGSSDVSEIRSGLADIRALAEKEGRDGSQIRALAGLPVITGRTNDEVQRRIDEYQSYYQAAPQLAGYAGWSGIDYAALGDDDPLPSAPGTNVATDHRQQTTRELRERFSKVTAFADERFIGTPEKVADAIAEFAHESGIDGFLLHQFVSPGSLEQFAELIVPQLEKRGLIDPTARRTPFRSRLRDDGSARLPADHPARRPLGARS